MNHPPTILQVGSLVKLTRPCLENPEGTVGVVYEVYERRCRSEHDTDRYGVSVLFPNGGHDGFSGVEQDLLLSHVGETSDPRVRTYQFRHVVRLRDDFENGFFTAAFGEGLRLRMKAATS